jgi:hypothetical protein
MPIVVANWPVDRRLVSVRLYVGSSTVACKVELRIARTGYFFDPSSVLQNDFCGWRSLREGRLWGGQISDLNYHYGVDCVN